VIFQAFTGTSYAVLQFRYGERKAIVEAEDWEGPAYESCRQAAWACKAFETVRRRTDLSFKHHAEVAALPPSDADALLDWCWQIPIWVFSNHFARMRLRFPLLCSPQTARVERSTEMPQAEWNRITIPEDGAIVYVLAQDNRGQYVIPFPVVFRDDSWWNACTGEELDTFIAGWRPADNVE
jgi:hypothetical protein